MRFYKLFLVTIITFIGTIQAGYANPAFTHQTKLIAIDGKPSDSLGASMATSGATLIVGAEGHDGLHTDSGAVYVFEQYQSNAQNWFESAMIIAADESVSQLFGRSVAIDGDTAVIGAPGDKDLGISAGAAYVFSRNPENLRQWMQIAKLTATDGAARDHFGASVTIKGDVIAVGANKHDANSVSDSGAVYIYRHQQSGNTGWVQTAKLVPADSFEGDNFGAAVALDGNTLAVGANSVDILIKHTEGFKPKASKVSPIKKAFIFATEELGDCTNDVGVVYVYSQDLASNQWQQASRFTGSSIDCLDHFGSNIAISKDTIAVGVPNQRYDDDLGAGAVYLYSRNHGGTDRWGESTMLLPANKHTDDHFGYSVDIHNDTLVVGAEGVDSGGFNTGSAVIYNRQTDDSWNQQATIKANQPSARAQFGSSVAVTDAALFVGAARDKTSGETGGAAYVFHGGGTAPGSRFSIAAGELFLPAVDVPGLGLYEATLQWDRTDRFGFQLSELVPISGTAASVASFNANTMTLHIPDVEVSDSDGATIRFTVDMSLTTNSSPLFFQVSRVR